MKTQFKNAITATIVAAVIYVVYLLVLGHIGKLPVENELIVLDFIFRTPLSFSVSYWWYLAVFPLAILNIALLGGQEKITGKEPRGVKEVTSRKYNARLSVHIAGMMFLSFFTAPIILTAFTSPFLTKEAYGPLSACVSFALFGLGMYILIGFCLGCVSIFESNPSSNYSDELSASDKYQTTLISFYKIGLIKTLPFTIGLTMAFVCQLIFGGVFKFFKSVKITIKREKISTL